MVASASYSYLPAYKKFGANVKIVHFIGADKPWMGEGAAPLPVSEYRKYWWQLYSSQVVPFRQRTREHEQQMFLGGSQVIVDKRWICFCCPPTRLHVATWELKVRNWRPVNNNIEKFPSSFNHHAYPQGRPQKVGVGIKQTIARIMFSTLAWHIYGWTMDNSFREEDLPYIIYLFWSWHIL